MVPKKSPNTGTYSGRFAVRLYELRKKAGLSAEEIAENVGVSIKTVYSWESANSAPHVSLYPAIAAILKAKKVKDILPNE